MPGNGMPDVALAWSGPLAGWAVGHLAHAFWVIRPFAPPNNHTGDATNWASARRYQWSGCAGCHACGARYGDGCKNLGRRPFSDSPDAAAMPLRVVCRHRPHLSELTRSALEGLVAKRLAEVFSLKLIVAGQREEVVHPPHLTVKMEAFWSCVDRTFFLEGNIVPVAGDIDLPPIYSLRAGADKYHKATARQDTTNIPRMRRLGVE